MEVITSKPGLAKWTVARFFDEIGGSFRLAVLALRAAGVAPITSSMKGFGTALQRLALEVADFSDEIGGDSKKLRESVADWKPTEGLLPTFNRQSG